MADPQLVIPSLVLVDIWHFAPFAMLILLAGLRSLPREPFESAMIDGASRWQMFWKIAVPLLRPVLVVVLIFRTIDALKVFDIIWVITAGGPGVSSGDALRLRLQPGLQVSGPRLRLGGHRRVHPDRRGRQHRLDPCARGERGMSTAVARNASASGAARSGGSPRARCSAARCCAAGVLPVPAGHG